MLFLVVNDVTSEVEVESTFLLFTPDPTVVWGDCNINIKTTNIDKCSFFGFKYSPSEI